MKNKSFILKLTKYFIGWWLAALLDLLLYYVFTRLLWIHYLYASALAFVFSFAFWFLFQKFITFSNKDKKYLKHWIYFLVFQLIWQAINLILLYILVDRFGFHDFYVVIFNKLIIFTWNYTMNYLFNFK